MAKYDKPLDKDEESKDAARYRLPFALCKQRGIELPDWATPRDAWNALRGYGINPDLEYKRLYEKKQRSEQRQREDRAKKEQARDPNHSPDYDYVSKPNHIAGVKKGEPMTFEQADGGAPNPYYNKIQTNAGPLFGYRTNCQTCVVAFEARLRGYDVRALPNNRNGYIRDLMRNTALAYQTDDGQTPRLTSRRQGEKIKDFLKRTVRPGCRYQIEFAYGKGMDGHIVNIYKKGNGYEIYDPQTGGRITDVLGYLRPPRATRHKILRVDNLQFNPEYVDHILKGVKK